MLYKMTTAMRNDKNNDQEYDMVTMSVIKMNVMNFRWPLIRWTVSLQSRPLPQPE